jgi:hypothetical protein
MRIGHAMQVLAAYPTAQAWCEGWDGAVFCDAMPGLDREDMAADLRDFGLQHYHNGRQLAVLVPSEPMNDLPISWPISKLAELTEAEGAGEVPVGSPLWRAGPVPWRVALGALQRGIAALATSDVGDMVRREDVLGDDWSYWVFTEPAASPEAKFKWTLT